MGIGCAVSLHRGKRTVPAVLRRGAHGHVPDEESALLLARGREAPIGMWRCRRSVETMRRRFDDEALRCVGADCNELILHVLHGASSCRQAIIARLPVSYKRDMGPDTKNAGEVTVANASGGVPGKPERRSGGAEWLSDGQRHSRPRRLEIDAERRVVPPLPFVRVPGGVGDESRFPEPLVHRIVHVAMDPEFGLISLDQPVQV